jgi:hypothetical protein
MIATTKSVTPPGYPDKRLVLTKEIQQLFRRVLAHLPDLHTTSRCFFELNADSFIVDKRTGQLFLSDAVPWTPNYDSKLAQKNYAIVQEIFRETFNGEVDSLPPDFQELLDLMKTKGDTASYAIQHHCSLVWPVDKKELFARIYDYADGTLRDKDPKMYEEVMENFGNRVPEKWHDFILENTHLAKFYNRGKYKPLGSDAGKEVLRFMRNTYSHCMEHARNMATKKEEYVREQMGEIMETALPRVLHSLQVALDEEGLLRNTMLESLFL